MGCMLVWLASFCELILLVMLCDSVGWFGVCVLGFSSIWCFVVVSYRFSVLWFGSLVPFHFRVVCE